MFYPNYLIHFNPNHDPKTGQFTFTKYSTSSGRISDTARKEFGIDKLDPNDRNFNPRKAKKEFKKEYKERLKEYRKGSNRVNDFFYDLAEEESEERLKSDIKKANENKQLCDDVKAAAKKYFSLEKDDWSAAFDYQDEAIRDLSKKYPEYEELLSWINIGETVTSSNFNKWANSKNIFPDILNNDTYYEPGDFLRDTEMDSVFHQANYELTKYFVDKYGQEVVPNDWVEFVKNND